MRYLWKLAGITAALLILTSLIWSRDNRTPRDHAEWKNGYWIWAGEPPLESSIIPEVLYVQVQSDRWPERVPKAHQYVVVRRLEPTAILSSEIPDLVRSYVSVVASAGTQPIVGLQLDYDCPTEKLGRYADFLKDLRQHLPQGTQLSITALLDWFRPGTRIQQVADQIDEFVPQFYDAGDRRLSAGIAEPIDAAKWAPVFNSLGVPYRIGISSFGRIARRRLGSGGKENVMFFRDASPLDFAQRQDLFRSTVTTVAGEVIAHYDIDDVGDLHSELAPGDTIDITFPTETSVRAAIDAVHKFGGYCAGLILFRWPNQHETLALTPDEVSILLEGGHLRTEPEIEVRDGACGARTCTDLYLLPVRDEVEQEIWIQAQQPFDLFLESGPLRPTVDRNNRIRVKVPAYSGLHHVYLGRAFSKAPLSFEVVDR